MEGWAVERHRSTIRVLLGTCIYPYCFLLSIVLDEYLHLRAVENIPASEGFNVRLLLPRIQMHFPARDDRNTFPALRTALFLSGLGSVPSEISCRGSVRLPKEKAQLAPGLHNHSGLGVARLYHNGYVSSLSGRNGPAMMASGIITPKFCSHLTHLTD